MTKLHRALSLAERGFHVFRLKRNGKIPFAKGWQDEATTDKDRVATLFEGHDFNIGIYTAKFHATQALVVVDIDMKEGQQGEKTFKGLIAMGYEFPDTYTVTTASGGRHLLYATPYPLKGGTNKLGANIDIKSSGGYVVAEGSTIDSKIYTPIIDTAPQPAPEWLIDTCGAPAPHTALHELPIGTIDTDQSISRAIAYLKDAAPHALQGSGGDNQTYKVAATCKNFGISEALAAELIFQYYNPRCQPPWQWDALLIKVANAYKHSTHPSGSLSPHNDFEPIASDPKEEEAETRQGLFYEWYSDIAAHTEYNPLIEDYLDQQALSVLYGDSNTGKTFIAMDMAFHIAAGIPWNNKKTTQGSVLYIAAEGGRAARNRISAWKIRHNQPDIPFALAPCPIDLFSSKADSKSLIKLVQQAEQEKGYVRLIVIDTLARAMGSGNENATEDMNTLVAHADAIRRHTRSHLMIVHHSGKDSSKGARGSSALRAAADTELEVTTDRLIRVRKQRDMDFAHPVGFEFQSVELTTSLHGKPITSCIINLVDAEARQMGDANQRMDPRDSIALAALKECKTGRHLRGFENVVDQKDWAKCCKDFDIGQISGASPWPKSDNSFVQAFRRARDRLVAFGRVEEIEEKQWCLIKT